MENIVVYNEGELEIKVSINKETIWNKLQKTERKEKLTFTTSI